MLRADERPPEERCYAGGLSVAVKVADADAEHARLAGLGVAVSDPVDQPWGERSFAFSDPDGYGWTFAQVL